MDHSFFLTWIRIHVLLYISFFNVCNILGGQSNQGNIAVQPCSTNIRMSWKCFCWYMWYLLCVNHSTYATYLASLKTRIRMAFSCNTIVWRGQLETKVWPMVWRHICSPHICPTLCADLSLCLKSTAWVRGRRSKFKFAFFVYGSPSHWAAWEQTSYKCNGN